MAKTLERTLGGRRLEFKIRSLKTDLVEITIRHDQSPNLLDHKGVYVLCWHTNEINLPRDLFFRTRKEVSVTVSKFEFFTLKIKTLKLYKIFCMLI